MSFFGHFWVIFDPIFGPIFGGVVDGFRGIYCGFGVWRVSFLTSFLGPKMVIFEVQNDDSEVWIDVGTYP